MNKHRGTRKKTFRNRLAVFLLAAVMSLGVTSSALATESAPDNYYCATSEELTRRTLSLFEQHTEQFELTFPSNLPEARMSFDAFLRGLELADTGPIYREIKSWGGTRRSAGTDKMTFEFAPTYKSTLEQTRYAREYAKKLVADMGLDGLSDYEKLDKLCRYIDGLEYDYSYSSETAYSTLTTGKGECEGLSLAMQYLLDEAGVASQILTGTLGGEGHAWLIVRLNGYWYFVEATTPEYDYLRNDYCGWTYPGQDSYMYSYLPDSFKATHPLASAPYNPENPEINPDFENDPAATSDNKLPSAPVARPTSSTVLVNGKKASFDAYTIDGSNYFKLRDLAYILNGTEKQFEVNYDNAAKTITLTSGKAYTPVGGEMTSKGSGVKTPTPTSSKIFLYGQETSFTAYTIDGNNYFKLRDIGQALNFLVAWDGASNSILIDAGKGYSEENAPILPSVSETKPEQLSGNKFIGTAKGCTPNEVRLDPKEIYYDGGTLVAEMFVSNGFDIPVHNLRNINISLSNGSGEFANGVFTEMYGAIIPAESYIVWTFRFSGDSVKVQDADLTFCVTAKWNFDYTKEQNVHRNTNVNRNPNEVTLTPAMVYYEGDTLVAEMYVDNGLEVPVHNLRDINISLSNGSVEFANGLFEAMPGAVIPAKSHTIWTFRFSGNAVSANNAVLTGSLKYSVQIKYDY